MPCSFCLWAYLSMFYVSSRLPVVFWDCCWNRRENAQLVSECEVGPSRICFLTSASLSFLPDCFYFFFLKSTPHSPENYKVILKMSTAKWQQRCCRLQVGIQFARVSLSLRANGRHERNGAKWAGIQSLALVKQRVSHASSQS